MMAGQKYAEHQKEGFFRLLDRGGTVRATARAVGVHEDAGYNWLRKTGLTMQRATPRVYSAELKANFLPLALEVHAEDYWGSSPLQAVGTCGPDRVRVPRPWTSGS